MCIRDRCRRYGGYSHSNGTDGMIFVKEPPVLGYYLIEKTYEPTVAWQGLVDGHVVVSIQHKGYWTRGGHYIALEEITESGKVRVRDSNIFNYNNRVKSTPRTNTPGAASPVPAPATGFLTIRLRNCLVAPAAANRKRPPVDWFRITTAASALRR